jgi:hypothetical protein
MPSVVMLHLGVTKCQDTYWAVRDVRSINWSLLDIIRDMMFGVSHRQVQGVYYQSACDFSMSNMRVVVIEMVSKLSSCRPRGPGSVSDACVNFYLLC